MSEKITILKIKTNDKNPNFIDSKNKNQENKTIEIPNEQKISKKSDLEVILEKLENFEQKHLFTQVENNKNIETQTEENETKEQNIEPKEETQTVNQQRTLTEIIENIHKAAGDSDVLNNEIEAYIGFYKDYQMTVTTPFKNFIDMVTKKLKIPEDSFYFKLDIEHELEKFSELSKIKTEMNAEKTSFDVMKNLTTVVKTLNNKKKKQQQKISSQFELNEKITKLEQLLVEKDMEISKLKDVIEDKDQKIEKMDQKNDVIMEDFGNNEKSELEFLKKKVQELQSKNKELEIQIKEQYNFNLQKESKQDINEIKKDTKNEEKKSINLKKTKDLEQKSKRSIDEITQDYDEENLNVLYAKIKNAYDSYSTNNPTKIKEAIYELKNKINEFNNKNAAPLKKLKTDDEMKKTIHHVIRHINHLNYDENNGHHTLHKLIKQKENVGIISKKKFNFDDDDMEVDDENKKKEEELMILKEFKKTIDKKAILDSLLDPTFLNILSDCLKNFRVYTQIYNANYELIFDNPEVCQIFVRYVASVYLRETLKISGLDILNPNNSKNVVVTQRLLIEMEDIWEIENTELPNIYLNTEKNQLEINYKMIKSQKDVNYEDYLKYKIGKNKRKK